MDPRLRAAIIEAAPKAPNPQWQKEIAGYAQSGGAVQLSPGAYAWLRVMLAPQNLALPQAVGGNVVQSMDFNQRPDYTQPGRPTPGAPIRDIAPPDSAGAGAAPNPGPQPGGTSAVANAPAPAASGVVDEFGRPTEQNYQERVAGDEDSVRQQVQQAAQAAGGGVTGGGQPPAAVPATPADANNPFNANQEIATAGADDTMLAQLAMKAMGLDLGRPGLFGKQIARFLLPLLQARRAAYGFQGGGGGQQGMTGLTQDILNFAKGATQQGGNFFQAAQQYGQGVANNPEFQQYLSRLTNPEEQQAALRSLQPLLYAGANPMVAQAIADETARQQLAYQTQSFQGLNPNSGVPAPSGIYGQFLGQQQQNDPFIQRLFGRSFR